jgi:hypothetical protein
MICANPRERLHSGMKEFPMKATPTSLRILNQLIRGIRSAIFTTRDADGTVHSRPMASAPQEGLRSGGAARLGRVNWTMLLWAVGVPLPIVLIVALMRGCT